MLGNPPASCSFSSMESSVTAAPELVHSVSAATVPRLRWGILATGRIAGVFAAGLKSARAGRLVAVGSRSAESAKRFAAEHGIDAAHTHDS